MGDKMLKLGIRVKTAGKPKMVKAFGESFGGWDDIQKAITHKYIRRIPKKSGKGWYYIYAETFKELGLALKTIFGVKPERIDNDYEKHGIETHFGADKKTFAAHVFEYLSNKLKWDNIFSRKENRDKYKKPVQQKNVTAAASSVKRDTPTPKDKTEQEKTPLIVNRSLMRKVWEIYNPVTAESAKIQDKQLDEAAKRGDTVREGDKNGGKNNPGTGSQELSPDTPAVRSGGSESTGDLDVLGGRPSDNEGQPGGNPDQSGRRAGGNLRGRRGRSAIKAIREQVKELLDQKTDVEMTEEDKALLRQYEGAGGLAEKGATTHGTLYEFYTPQKVVDKVWSLVDKYNPKTDKTVIEPSAGTGRFAEGRPESFNLFELDETSARIAGILHPDAEIKQGAFQELFMNGRTPKKKYDGKKFDVAIGNPPYGAYSGLYKGMGEGKEHNYIHEYFIDRSLDTLKDGGILAMVVPSSFLRGKNSKAKEQIAGKAKLLEAWRLPNGTFGTTEVGTDIIVLRKEKGDIADFTDNKYFETYEDHIAGVERDKQGKFGIEKYVAPPDGMGFDESLELIDPAKAAYAPEGEKTPEQQAVENIEAKVSEADEHRNRSEAMTGNDNAAGDRGGQEKEPKKKRRKKDEDTFTPSIGESLTADEFNEKYGIAAEKADLPIWKATDYDGRIEVSKLFAKDKKRMEISGNFTVDGAGNWYSISNYASGNIYDKLDQLERDREVLGEERYKINKSLLESVKPQPKSVDNFTVSPISDFAKEYKMVDDEGTERDLRDAFFKWAGVETRGYGRKTYRSIDWNESPISQFEIPSGISFSDVIAYIEQESLRTDKATAREFDAETAKMEKEDKRKKRRETAENLFNRFLREGLTDTDRKNLQDTWNRRFNSVVNPDYTKIPITVNGMNTHKGEKKFDLLPQQVKGISFLCNKGNGILAHEVGVGKTVSGIVATVNQMQNGRSKKPLICVPKAVYRKWIKEIHQHFPDIKVNELENFSDKNIAGFRDEEGGLNIEPGTISVMYL
jgi:hypothetical protein